MLRNQRGFAPILIVLLVVILAIVGYDFYENYQARDSTDTARPPASVIQKTYINNTYGYSIEYPSTWNVNEAVDKTLTTFTSYEERTGNQPFKLGDLKIEIHSNDPQFISRPTENGQETMLADQKGYVIKKDQSALASQGISDLEEEKFIYLDRNGKRYAIEVYIGKGNVSTNLIDQILSTFKFTDAATDMANWKTYTNTKVGFTLKYPRRFSPPALPNGFGGMLTATGNEESGPILFGQLSENNQDGFEFIIFPYKGELADLPVNQQFKSTPPYDWSSNEPNSQYKSENIQVDNLPALILTKNYLGSNTDEGAKLPYEGIFFVHDGYGYGIVPNQGHDVMEINQILSTFKFSQ